MEPFWQTIEQRLSQEAGSEQRISSHRELGGGCINQAFAIQTGRDRWFIKTNHAELEPMFAAEALALQELAETQTIRVPKPLTHGQADNRSFLILEYIEMDAACSPAQFGQQMAQLHQIQQPYFGWQCHNTIGKTPQPNSRHEHWVTFFANQRLGFQRELAQRNGAPASLLSAVEKLQGQIGIFFTDHNPFPSLLHGDLWSGNWSCDSDGAPVIFDPASYYGDHEADLAMMELFGHPGVAFFDAYHETLPIASGYKIRKVLYNLYHILNHFNLFGGGYASQAERMCQQLLSET